MSKREEEEKDDDDVNVVSVVALVFYFGCFRGPLVV